MCVCSAMGLQPVSAGLVTAGTDFSTPPATFMKKKAAINRRRIGEICGAITAITICLCTGWP